MSGLKLNVLSVVFLNFILIIYVWLICLVLHMNGHVNMSWLTDLDAIVLLMYRAIG